MEGIADNDDQPFIPERESRTSALLPSAHDGYSASKLFCDAAPDPQTIHGFFWELLAAKHDLATNLIFRDSLRGLSGCEALWLTTDSGTVCLI